MKVYATSPDGSLSVIAVEDYNAVMVGKPRSGTRCDCGGSDPVGRATKGPLTSPPWGKGFGCWHPTYVAVNTADLPQAAGVVRMIKKDPASTTYNMPIDGGWTMLKSPAFTGTGVPAKVVEEWPATCPRCGSAKSAVVLFNSIECRKGCFS